jgi:hypothetical protein
MTATASHVHIAISGATAAEVLKMAAELGGSTVIAGMSTDDLLAEVRDRFAKASPAMVVRVEPFSSGAATVGDGGPAAANGKAPTKAEQKAAAKAATDAALKEAATNKEAPKATTKETQQPTPANDAGGGDWDSDSGGEETAAPTVDDVKAALNTYSAKHGQAATRDVMKNVGGSMKLLDIPADKYQALIEKLAA